MTAGSNIVTYRAVEDSERYQPIAYSIVCSIATPSQSIALFNRFSIDVQGGRGLRVGETAVPRQSQSAVQSNLPVQPADGGVEAVPQTQALLFELVPGDR